MCQRTTQMRLSYFRIAQGEAKETKLYYFISVSFSDTINHLNHPIQFHHQFSCVNFDFWVCAVAKNRHDDGGRPNLLGGVDDLDKIGLEGGASDEGTVDVRALGQLAAVVSGHGASVQDPQVLGNLG